MEFGIKEWGKRVKEQGEDGKKRKERLADNPGNLKATQMACQAWGYAFDAIISCHKLTNKMFDLPWSGSELLRTSLFQNILEAEHRRQQWRNLDESKQSMQVLQLQLQSWIYLFHLPKTKDCKGEVLKFLIFDPHHAYLYKVKAQLDRSRNNDRRKLICMLWPLSMNQTFDWLLSIMFD